MRLKVLTGFVFVSLVGGIVAPVAAQSLGEIAKREAERRKAIAAPQKPITNSDLKPVLPPESTPAPAPTGTTSAGATASGDAAKSTADAAKAADGAPAPGAAKDQAYWSGRLKTLETQLSRDRDFADALQVKINAQTTDFVNTDDPAQRARIETERNRSLGELDRLRKAIADGQKAISDLQEEARQAGVPPGWLR